MNFMDFIRTYQTELISSLVTLILVLVMVIITGRLYKWSHTKLREKGYFSSERPLRVIRRILNGLWIILGISVISLFFLGGKTSELVRSNVKLTIYLASVIVVTVIVANLSNYWFKENIQKRGRLEEDATSLKFLRYVVLVAVYFVGALLVLMAFPSLKGVAQTALGGAGILAIVAGIASQEALANLIGGFFIIWFKPFRIGNTIKVDDIQGVVSDITLRHTVIKDYDNNRIVIPNSIINRARVVNFDYQETKVCERIEVRVSYSSDLKLAQKIMSEICEAHPLLLDVRSPAERKQNAPRTKTAITRIEDSAMIVRVWAWAANVDDGYALRFSVLEQIKERFDREGVEIPHPYRSLIFQRDNRELEPGEN